MITFTIVETIGEQLDEKNVNVLSFQKYNVFEKYKNSNISTYLESTPTSALPGSARC